MTRGSITVSVVSHGQNNLVNRFLADLAAHCPVPLHVILTENIADVVPLHLPDAVHRFEVVANDRPKGFGANHNSAFARCQAEAFFVVNPDIRLVSDPFTRLAAYLAARRAAVVGPIVRNAAGVLEDSARRFPTVRSLLGKLVRGSTGPEYPIDRGPLEVDWLAGMFLGFRKDAYAEVNGFDERFFLYYEDVDICRRLTLRGHKVLYDTTVSVIHEAQRASRRDPRLMRIHAASAFRYLIGRYRP
jgi:N-acetylglucosaminyl-diphospho-decaprenol L-rhamnosyltransferase